MEIFVYIFELHIFFYSKSSCRIFQQKLGAFAGRNYFYGCLHQSIYVPIYILTNIIHGIGHMQHESSSLFLHLDVLLINVHSFALGFIFARSLVHYLLYFCHLHRSVPHLQSHACCCGSVVPTRSFQSSR